jgi:hypothetical protein
VKDGRLRDRRTRARGRAAQGALLDVTGTAAGRVEVDPLLVRVTIEMMEENVGAR